MAIFMLHFDCKENRAGRRGKHTTADACVISDSLEQAEAVAREAIQSHDYEAGALIAFSQIDKSRVVELDENDTVLYLRAMKQSPAVAVVFT